jgi:peptidoglycan/LPS O-acetylase OafA/YrhL/transglutaminase-like putative cysteine protease
LFFVRREGSRQWVEAFSPRENLRRLFHAPATDQAPLYGFRALVILWTLAMHTAYLLAFHIPRSRWLPVADSHTYRWIHRGELAVDGFFVLSGYLIAYFLIAEYRESGTINVARFYGHRFLRLSPLLWVVLFGNWWITGEKSTLWWTNVTYVNNFSPYERQYMPWTWSLAVEEQFYVVFPLFLLLLYRWRRFRLSTLLALLAAAFAVRGWLILHHDIQLPLALVESVTGPGASPWALYADTIYVKPYTRFGAILCGIIAAYLRHYTGVNAWLLRRPTASSSLLLGAFTMLGLVVAAPMHDLAQSWSPGASLLYLTSHRNLAAIAMASLILLTLSPAGLAKPLARFLGLRVWYPLAITAYASYLVQPILINQAYYYAAKYLRDHDKSVPAVSGGLFTLLFLAVAAATFVVCAALFVLVERPFMNLRRRPLSQTPVPPTVHPAGPPALLGEPLMRTPHRKVLLTVSAALLFATLAAAGTATSRKRAFEFNYTAKIEEVPAGAGKVEVWVPYPQSDEHQKISDVRVETPVAAKVFTEKSSGNSMLHFVVEKPQQPIELRISFDVERREYVNKDFPRSGGDRHAKLSPDVARWLKPEKLVPIDERIRTLAQEVTAGQRTSLEKARAIYEYVVKTMAYDKSGTGWGNGDIYWACDAKRGNCTDFHALFIGLNRAVGIPARFSIGFPLPANSEDQGEVGGYHCWAEFYLPGFGWVPVDASEAKKNLDKKDYFFGALDEHRVQLTMGRDLKLEPRQQGEPLNYFVYPYVEVDGKPHKSLAKNFSYRKLDGGMTGSR